MTTSETTAASAARPVTIGLPPGLRWRKDGTPTLLGDRIARFDEPSNRDRKPAPFPAYERQPEPLGPLAASHASIQTRVYFARGSSDAKSRWSIFIPTGAGSSFYGTGEQAGSLRRNGTRKVCDTTDSFAYTEKNDSLYQAHPWVLVIKPDGSAMGVIAETTGRCVLDLTRPDGVLFESDSDIRGVCPSVVIIERLERDTTDHPDANVRAVLRALAELTGTIPLPPKWALGYHQCRWSYEPDAKVKELAHEFRARRMPCDVIWLDIDYMDGFRCFTFDSHKFPDPHGLNEHLHAQGFKTVWMIDPGIKVDDAYHVYASGKAGGHFVKDANGHEFHGKVWPGPCAFPDFTRESARNWWAGLYADYLSRGIDGVWNDMNEPAVFDVPGKHMPIDCLHEPDESLWKSNGNTKPRQHAHWRNVYGMLMVRASREGIAAARPDKRPFILTRSNFLGGHRYAATWTGDNESDWTHLSWSIPMVLNLGLSGQAFCGPDIGGFAGEATGPLFARWMGIGALLPFARGHSIKGSKDHEPWSFGPDCERACRLALERRMRLLPYLYTLFFNASRDGLPICRPVFFLDPSNPLLRTIEDQFLLGDDILVRACVEPTNLRRSALPHEILRRERTLGGWRKFEPTDGTHPDLPELYVRPGAIIPLSPVMQHCTEKPLDPLTLIVCRDAHGKAVGDLYEDEGEGHAHRAGEYRVTRFTAVPGDGVISAVREGVWAQPEREVRVIEI
jgi:alpha-glucosidase